MNTYEKPSEEQWFTPQNFYEPTIHFVERYRKRMTEQKSKVVTKHILLSTEEELGLRANYMLLFSIHGRAGERPNTEVRYYFDWEIVIDNKRKSIITMYQMRNQNKLPAVLFGDPKLRKEIYRIWFKRKQDDKEMNSEND